MRDEQIYAAEAERLRQGLNEWADEGRLPAGRSAALAESVRRAWSGTAPGALLHGPAAQPPVSTRGRRIRNWMAGAAAAAALLLALPLAWPPARAWATDTFPVIATFLGLRAQADPGWAWALEHEGFQEVLAQAEDRGYTFRIHRVLADPTQTAIVFTVAGPEPAEPDFWAGETDGFWFNGKYFGTALSVDGSVLDGVWVGVVEIDPLPEESGSLRINLNAIGDVRGRWVVEFPVTRQALTAVSRTIPVGQPIGPEGLGLQVEEVVVLPTRTEVRVMWEGRVDPGSPGPDIGDLEVRTDSGVVVPFQGSWGEGRGDRDGNRWFRWHVKFDPLPPDAKAITVSLKDVAAVTPGERLVLPLAEGATGELPGLPQATVRTVVPGKATVEYLHEFSTPFPYAGWVVVDDRGDEHAVSSQGTSAPPGERVTATATITWDDLPRGRTPATLEARWVWRTYEGDWRVEIPLK